MKEGADVYRVRDNQRGATLIIVIGVLSLKRCVTRRGARRVRCVEIPATRVTHAGGFKEADRSDSARAMYACTRSCDACIRALTRARIVHVRCSVRYASLLTNLFAGSMHCASWADTNIDY